MRSSLMQRIRFPDIRIRRREQQLNMELQSLVNSYRRREIGKPELRRRGERVLRKHYVMNTDLVDQYVRGKGIVMKSGESDELKKMLDTKILDWNNLVTDLRLP